MMYIKRNDNRFFLLLLVVVSNIFTKAAFFPFSYVVAVRFGMLHTADLMYGVFCFMLYMHTRLLNEYAMREKKTEGEFFKPKETSKKAVLVATHNDTLI